MNRDVKFQIINVNLIYIFKNIAAARIENQGQRILALVQL